MVQKINNPQIYIGFRVGMLTVKEATPERKNRYTVWHCVCDCGGSILLDTRCLQRGTVRDCGCSTVVRPGMLDLTGQRFGRLVCLAPSPEKDRSGNTQWLCQCDCGRTCLASLHQLRAGDKKSCGCLSHPPRKDYIGKQFGKLTVTAYAGKVKGMHRWQCLCECGNTTVVGQTLLQSGKTRSCGCLNHLKTSPEKLPKDRGLIDGTCVSSIVARMNKPPISSNSSGYNGVYKTTNGLWAAQITFKGKTYYLGCFKTVREAAAARKRGEEMYEDFLLWYYSECSQAITVEMQNSEPLP